MIFALFLLAVFSIIPYKTPWNILGLVPLMAILGGSGLMYLYQKAAVRYTRLILIFIFMIMLAAEGFESYRVNYLYAADTASPFTYGHSRQDVTEIGRIMDGYFSQDTTFARAQIAAIAAGGDYWPLPWHLRRFKNVGYWNEVPEGIGDADIIFVSPDLESDLVRHLYELTPFENRHLYLPLFERDMELRPGVMIRAYISIDLWQIMNADISGN